VSAPLPPPPSLTPPAPPAPVGPTTRRLSVGASTPARIRLISAGTALLAVLLAVFGWIAVSRRDQSLDRTGDAAARLISVQEIRSAIIEADSIATTTFLVGGLEPADQRARYEARLGDAAAGLALLSGGLSGGDLDQLTAANSTLNAFSGLVEQARANNRQGFPVGAAYQRQASALVRDQLLTSIETLEQHARDDVNDNIASAHRIGWVLPLAGIVVLAAMVAGSVWLFRRTHRLLNVPVALAALITVVVVCVGVFSMGGAMSSADDVVTGDLRQADRNSQVRVAGFEARSDEALTLINRGNGQANENDYQQAATTVFTILGGRGGDQDLADLFAEYDTLHGQLRTLDDGGDWEQARDQLLNRSARAFDSFSSGVEQVVQARSSASEADLADAGSGLGTTRIVLVIGALVAAGLVIAGYGQRLREYR